MGLSIKHYLVLGAIVSTVWLVRPNSKTSVRSPASVPMATEVQESSSAVAREKKIENQTLDAPVVESEKPVVLPDRAPAFYLVESLRNDANEAVKDGRLASNEVEEYVEERLAVWQQQVDEMQEQLPGDDFVVNEEEN